MRKLLVTLFIFINFCLNTLGSNSENSLSDVIKVIMYIESKNNANAVSRDGQCVGIMQIKKVVVDDCNQYLKFKGIKKSFNYNDRFDKDKSVEMFLLVQERYKNYKRHRSKSNVEHMIRIWNGGCNYTIDKTDEYYKNVMKALKETNKSEIDY